MSTEQTRDDSIRCEDCGQTRMAIRSKYGWLDGYTPCRCKEKPFHTPDPRCSPCARCRKGAHIRRVEPKKPGPLVFEVLCATGCSGVYGDTELEAIGRWNDMWSHKWTSPLHTPDGKSGPPRDKNGDPLVGTANPIQEARLDGPMPIEPTPLPCCECGAVPTVREEQAETEAGRGTSTVQAFGGYSVERAGEVARAQEGGMSRKTASNNTRYRVSIVLIVESPTMDGVGADITAWLRSEERTKTNDTRIAGGYVCGWCPEKGKR